MASRRHEQGHPEGRELGHESGDPQAGERQRLSLEQSVSFLLEECRMVVPGAQALFGFQLIAVFSEAFGRELSRGEQQLHILAVALGVLALGLVMAPAAVHRQSEPHHVSDRFVHVASRLLLCSMIPMGLAICLDAYLVSRVVFHSEGAAWAVSASLFAFLMAVWLVLPRVLRARARRPAHL